MSKPRKRTLTKQKKELWKYFSAYIKARDGNKCISCGALCFGRNAQAGHFIPSSTCGLGLRYDERNVHCQCSRCNIFLSGNYVSYREELVRRHGAEYVAQLEAERHNITKDFDYEKATEHYKQICSSMGITVR